MGDKKKIRLPSGLVLADTGEGGEIVVEVFENERFLPTLGWLAPTSFISSDRAHFSNENGQHGIAVSTLDQLDKPDIGGVLEWLDDRWNLDKSFDVGCDEFGWSYALEWYFLSKGHVEERDLSNSDHCFVRRRRWLRRLRRVSQTELKDREARLASSSGAEVSLVLKGKEGEKLGVTLRYHDVACSVFLDHWLDEGDSVLKLAMVDFKRQHPSAIYQPSLGDIIVEINGLNLIGHPFRRCVEMVRDACEDGLLSVRLRKKPDRFTAMTNVEDKATLDQVVTETSSQNLETKTDVSLSDWMARRTGSGLTKQVENPILGGSEDKTEEDDTTSVSFADRPSLGCVSEQLNEEAITDLYRSQVANVESIDVESTSLTTLPSGLISSNIPTMQFSSLTDMVMTALGPTPSTETVVNLSSKFEECPSSDDESFRGSLDHEEEEEKDSENIPFGQIPSQVSKEPQGFFDMLQRATPFSKPIIPSAAVLVRPPTPPLPDEELKAAMLLNHQPLVMRSKNSTRSVRFAEQLEEVKYIERVVYGSSDEVDEEDEAEELQDKAIEELGDNTKVHFQLQKQSEPGLALVSGRQSEFV